MRPAGYPISNWVPSSQPTRGGADAKIPSDNRYYITMFGGGTDAQGVACPGQPRADGSYYYIADKDRFGCGSRVRITDPVSGRSVVAVAVDIGPALWVERNAGGPIIDASPLVTRYLFGRDSFGWSDRKVVVAERVDPSTPLGPTSGGGGAVLVALGLAGLTGLAIWYLERNAKPRRNPMKDEESIALMAPGAIRRLAREAKRKTDPARIKAVLANQAQWEKLEGHWILRVPGRPIAAVPTTGKQNAANFIVFNVETREELTQLKRSEVFGWLTREAIG